MKAIQLVYIDNTSVGKVSVGLYPGDDLDYDSGSVTIIGLDSQGSTSDVSFSLQQLDFVINSLECIRANEEEDE